MCKWCSVWASGNTPTTVCELIRQTDAKGQVTTYSYDVLGRMVARNEPSMKAWWSYDKNSNTSSCGAGIGKLCETGSDTGYRKRQTYDNIGRPVRTETWLDKTTPYTQSVVYDSNSRITSRIWPTGVKVDYAYTDVGGLVGMYLNVPGAATSQRLWQASSFDTRGHIVKYQYGNNIDNLNSWSADTDRLISTNAGVGNGTLSQNYYYDVAGNLTARKDNNLNVLENFSYDNLNRLTGESVQANGVNRTNNWRYNAIGSMLAQSEVGPYRYNASGNNSVRPHAVTQVQGTVGKFANPVYSYDANGNISAVSSTNGYSRSQCFTSFNMPNCFTMSGASASFGYGTDYGRVRETLSINDGKTITSRTIYQLHPDQSGGLFYEREIKADGSIEHRHFVSNSIVLISTTDTASQSKITGIRYWHKDHLGSIAAVTDENGKLVERLAYDPFGRRRQPSGAIDAAGNIRPISTNRGFTGHEHLDDMASFIHMNGRIFDPILGRFLSPDKFVQGPNNLQSHNRYSYLFNSPLNGTDPSGFLGETNIPLDLGGVFGNLYGGPQMGTALGTMVSGIANGMSNLGNITVYDNNGNPYASNPGPGLANIVLTNVNPDIGANIGNIISNVTSNIGAGVNSPVFIEHLDWSLLTGGSAYNGVGAGVSTLTTLKNVIVPSMDIWDTGSLDAGGDATSALMGRPVVNLGFDNRQRAMARGATVGAALLGTAGGLFGSGCAVASGGLCAFGIPALISAGASGGALLGATIAGLAVDVGQLIRSESSGSSDPADILAPAGQPVGENVSGAKPGVQTVPPDQLTDIIDRLKGGGANLDPNSRYPGEWYNLPNGQGGFGIRDSKDSGRTLDVNIPGVPDVTKIHQR